MKKLIVCLVWVLISNSKSYSQRIEVIGRDTLHCLTDQQAKGVIKVYYGLKECNQLKELSIKEIQELKLQNTYKDSIIRGKDKIIAGRDSLQLIDKEENSIYKRENKSLRTEVRKQTTLRNILGVVIIVISVLFAVK